MAGSDFIEIKMTEGSLEFIDALRKRMGVVPFTQSVLKFFGVEALRVAGKVSRLLTTGELGIRRRDGTLAKSVVGVPDLHDGAPSMRVGILRGSALKYAGVQEYGTKGKNPASPFDTIRPKKGKALAIPTDEVKVAKSGRIKAEFAGGPRERNDLTFIPFGKRPNLIGGLFTRKSLEKARGPEGPLGGKGKIDFAKARAAYLLVRQVDIAPKRYLHKGVTTELPNTARRLMKFLASLIDPPGGSNKAPAPAGAPA